MQHIQKIYESIKQKPAKNAEVFIEGELPLEAIEPYRKKVLDKMRAELSLPGFRKGQVPPAMIAQYINEFAALEEAAEKALIDACPLILEHKQIVPIALPRITVTKLAPGNPVAFTIAVSVMPEITLPDYRKIGESVMKTKKPVEVSDKEVEDTVSQLLAMRAAPEGGGGQPKIPELTNEFVKKIGNFESVSDFKTKLRENIKQEKEVDQRQGLREEIAKQLVDKSKMTLPKVLVEDELSTMQLNRESELGEMGLTVEEYLQRIKKTREEMEHQERAHVERQLKTRFILQKIAEKEHITPESREVEQNMHSFMARYPNADPVRTRGYIETMVRNEKVLQMLEGDEKPGDKKPA